MPNIYWKLESNDVTIVLVEKVSVKNLCGTASMLWLIV